MIHQEALLAILDKLSQILTAGLLSMFGGIAAYIYQNVKHEKKFSLGAFCIISFLAFFAGNLVGSFIPNTFSYRDGVLMLTGFVSFPLLGLLEEKGKHIIVRLIESRIFSAIDNTTEKRQDTDLDK